MKSTLPVYSDLESETVHLRRPLALIQGVRIQVVLQALPAIEHFTSVKYKKGIYHFQAYYEY